ncbi:MAG TPA: FG-GAP-like repeat-containing protein [Phycisphaerales bacterium]|nr:FG-GAP-like repeat-containing protein [Phycisphaerales bacterium]
MLNRFRWVMLAVWLMCAWSAPALAQSIVYVRANAPAGGNGQSWATAYNDLQSAISAAAAVPAVSRNIQIWVATGTYFPGPPGAPRSTSFSMLNGVTLLGGFAGNESAATQANPRLNTTTLSGDLGRNDVGPVTDPTRDDNSYHVVTAGGVDNTARIEGFLIRGGQATLPYGGGTPQPDSDGGGLTTRGGGSPVIHRCTFIGNRAANSGGAIFLGQPGTPEVTGCTFVGNHGMWDTGAVCVGEYFGTNTLLAATIESCFFSGNYGRDGGSAILVVGTSHAAPAVQVTANIVGCTFSGQTFTPPSNYASSVWAHRRSLVSIRNCIFWNEPATPVHAFAGGSVSVRRSLVQNGAAGVTANNGTATYGTDNISVNPLFQALNGPDGVAGTIDDDPTLTPSSPCIDLADESYLTPCTVADVLGNSRWHDGDSNGTVLSDLGAAERGAGSAHRRLYVRPGGNGGGRSWADALGSPNGASAQSTCRDPWEVWVAAGTYRPAPPGGDRNASFQLRSRLALFGGFAGTETTINQRDFNAHQTILSGDLQGDDVGFYNRADNAHHVVTGENLAASAILDGFIIEHGGEGIADIGGGGIYLNGGGATIRNCLIRDNVADAGAGVQAISPTGLRFENCTFHNNRTDRVAPDQTHAWDGAAFQGSGGNGLVFDGCIFQENHSDYRAGVMYITSQTGILIQNCRLIRNRSEDVAGAVLLYQSQASIYNSEFYGNRSALDHNVLAWASNTTIAGCAFVGNTARYHSSITGSSAFETVNTLRVINSTIVANEGLEPAQYPGAISATGNGTQNTLSLQNCIVTGNTNAGVESEHTNISVLSGVYAWSVDYTIHHQRTAATPGTGSHGGAPLFRRAPSKGPNGSWGDPDDDYGDLRVQAGSPALDSGFLGALPPDIGDMDRDQNLTEVLPFDLARQPRFVDDPNAPNTGPGSAPHVDRGCYENNLSTTVWSNPAGGQWTLAANWLNSVLPNSNTRVLFDSTAGGSSNSYSVQLPSDQHAYSMEVSANQVTFNARSGSFNGDLFLDAPIADPNPSLLISRTAPAGVSPALTITNSGGSTTTRRGLSAGSTTVANETGSRGALIIGDTNPTNGQRTRFTASGRTQIGGAGAGVLTIQSRALAQVESLVLAAQQTASATASITGASSIPSTLAYGGLNADLVIAHRGQATLTVGGTLASGLPDATKPGLLTSEGNPADDVILGEVAGSSGTVRILGPGSAWVSEHSNFILGKGGHAHLTIDAGQLLTTTSNNIIFAQEPGSSALLELKNGASWIENSAGAVIGGAGFAELRIDSTSTVSISGGPLRIDPAGTMTGNGAVSGDVRNRGTIVPTVGTAPLTIDGSYEQVSSDPANPYAGNIILGVNGTAAGQYASIEINGAPNQIRIGGGLIVHAPAGFALDQPLRLISTPGTPAPFDVALLPRLVTTLGLPTNQYLRIEYNDGGADLGFGLLQGGIGFDAPVDFPVPGTATDAVLADMDNDGLIDLAVTIPAPSGGPGSAFIFFNAGDADNDGDWDGFASSTQITTGINPLALTVCNFDGQRGLDLAVANQASSSVSVIYHLNDRTFGSTQTHSVGVSPVAIASAALNDPLELPAIAVALSSTPAARLMLNNQDPLNNSFLLQPPIVLPVPPRRIRLPDLDNDKRMDILLMGDGSVMPFHNVGNSVMGPLPPIPVGAGTFDLRTADLDNDGRTDFITSNQEGGSVSIILNRTADSGPALLPAVELPVAAGATSLASIDLEGDGDSDLAVIAEGAGGTRQVRLLRNDLDSSGLLVFSQLPAQPSGEDPLFVLSANVDARGLDELVTVNQSGGGGFVPGPAVIVNPNAGTPPPPPCGDQDFNGDGDLGTDADIEAFFACLGGNCCETCYAGGADFNADGDWGTDADIESFFRVLGGGPC